MANPSTPSPSPQTMAKLWRNSLSLGAANAFDYALQFILPVLLVRLLPAEAFGGYRLLWLLIMTAMMLVPLSMHQSLYFFLPRADAALRRLHVHHTLLYLLVAGLLGGLIISPWNPLLPNSMASLSHFGILVPCLLVLFAVTLLLDLLPTIDERVHWQAGMVMGLALLRTLTLGLGAWLSGDLGVLIWLLLGLYAFKGLLLLYYVSRWHGLGGPWLRPPLLAEQFTHAAPLGLSSGLYGLRIQADQWVAASLFALQSFAAFSIAATLGPLVNICRQSVNHVFLPTMSRLQAEGDVAGMVRLNSSANLMVARLVYPLLALAFVFAPDLISLVYTSTYVEAAPVMRVYVLGLVAFTIELSSIILLLREGNFSLRLNSAALALSVLVSWLAAGYYGLAGAALGSTLALYVDRIATLQRISHHIGIPVAGLQDWPALASLLLYASLAGALSWTLTAAYLGDAAHLTRVIAGALILGGIYLAFLLLAEYGPGRQSLIRHPSILP